MKNFYIFLIIPLFYGELNAQPSCSEADSDINYAYSHAKSAYDSNNISDLKYYANRSLEAFQRAEGKLKECGCGEALENSANAILNLEKVDTAETYEDSRFFMKRARSLANTIIGDLDNCNQISQEEEELLDLEMEQKLLKEKQMALQQKQAELKERMIEQKMKEERLQKEILMSNYESAIRENINTYNESLRMCGCNGNIENTTTTSDALYSLSDADIREHYITIIKNISALYLAKLDTCNAR